MAMTVIAGKIRKKSGASKLFYYRIVTITNNDTMQADKDTIVCRVCDKTKKKSCSMKKLIITEADNAEKS